MTVIPGDPYYRKPLQDPRTQLDTETTSVKRLNAKTFQKKNQGFHIATP